MRRITIIAGISGVIGILCYFLAFSYLPKLTFLYDPFNWLYQSIYKFYPLSSKLFLILLSFLIAIILFFTILIIDKCTEEKPLTSRGSARWANNDDVKDLVKSKGVPIGRFNGKILRNDKTHLITCAGTRSGKGIGAIIPTLLEYPDSLVCLDIKGENYEVTGATRKEFGKVFVLNPFNVLGIKTNSYNWLDSINLSADDCANEALKIASILVGGSSSNGEENHFNEQAKTLLQGVILLVADEKEELRNMLTVARLIRKTPFNQLCQLMINKGHLASGQVGDIGAQFLNNTNDKELSGILSTAQRAIRNLSDPQISKTLIKSDFDISRLPAEKMSIYLVMPADKVSDFKDYIKVFFELAFSSITSPKYPKKYPVLFLLDEVAQIGYMDRFPKLITLVKGMGAQLWFFFQDVGQIRSIYGKDAATLLGNATQIFYGCNDYETAELISKTLGKKTVKEFDEQSKKYHLIARDLLTPDEVRQLPVEKPIILMAGRRPIKVDRINYLKDSEYKGLFDKNPYFTN